MEERVITKNVCMKNFDMTDILTNEFDNELLNNIDNYKRYKEMLPFVGISWSSSDIKTLILGESHYIDRDGLTKEQIQDWYNFDSTGFSDYLSGYINTRKVITKAEKIDEYGFQSPLTIFYNIKSSLKDNIDFFKSERYPFKFLTFSNYFQRPAFDEGESIINSHSDNVIAYKTLLGVVEIIRPKKIIFTSSKAYYSFLSQRTKEHCEGIFSEIIIDSVPHPSCAWWNRTSPNYGNRTGRQKFIDLMK